MRRTQTARVSLAEKVNILRKKGESINDRDEVRSRGNEIISKNND